MKTSKSWFKHDIGTLSDDKIFALVLKFGAEGYGIFWGIIEALYENNGQPLSNISLMRIAKNLIVDSQKVFDVAEYAASPECDHLLSKVEGGYTSLRVCKQREATEEISRINTENIGKRWNREKAKNEGQNNTNSIPTEYESNTDCIRSEYGGDTDKIRKDKIRQDNIYTPSNSNELSGVCAEMKNHLTADTEKKAQAEPVFLVFPALKGKTYPITESQIKEWEEVFPAVDVRQQVRNALSWLKANPKNAKSNIKAYLNNWLTKEQNRARPNNSVENTIKGTDIPMTNAPKSMREEDWGEDNGKDFNQLFEEKMGWKK